MSLADAISAPRIHHQALPDETFFEHDGLSDATVQAVQAMGHKLQERRGGNRVLPGGEKNPRGGVGGWGTPEAGRGKRARRNTGVFAKPTAPQPPPRHPP